jgi:hypothetical protein
MPRTLSESGWRVIEKKNFVAPPWPSLPNPQLRIAGPTPPWRFPAEYLDCGKFWLYHLPYLVTSPCARFSLNRICSGYGYSNEILKTYDLTEICEWSYMDTSQGSHCIKQWNCVYFYPLAYKVAWSQVEPSGADATKKGNIFLHTHTHIWGWQYTLILI